MLPLWYLPSFSHREKSLSPHFLFFLETDIWCFWKRSLKKKTESPSSDFAATIFLFMLQKLWREKERRITPIHIFSLHSETHFTPALCLWDTLGHLFVDHRQRHKCNLLPFTLGSSTIITLQNSLKQRGADSHHWNHLVMPVQLENNAKTNKHKAIVMQSM